MKNYIICSDHHLKLLVIIAQLVERHFNFTYKAFSVALTVEVHDVVQDAFEAICKHNNVDFKELPKE